MGTQTFNNPLLNDLLNQISAESTNNEFYLFIKNDVIDCAVKKNNKIHSYQTPFSKLEFEDALNAIKQIFQIESDLYREESVCKRFVSESENLDLRLHSIAIDGGFSIVVRQINILTEMN